MERLKKVNENIKKMQYLFWAIREVRCFCTLYLSKSGSSFRMKISVDKFEIF